MSQPKRLLGVHFSGTVAEGSSLSPATTTADVIDRLVSARKAQQAAAATEEGSVVVFETAQLQADARKFVFVEVYADQAGYDAHRQTAAYKVSPAAGQGDGACARVRARGRRTPQRG